MLDERVSVLYSYPRRRANGVSVDSETEGRGAGDQPAWPQRMLDNIWVLLALGVLIPAVLYLGWGLWELAELPTWGGQ